MIDIEKIIKEGGLDPIEVAGRLFPGNKFPTLALNRIKRKKAVLDENQILELSRILNVPPSDLFEDKDWGRKTVGGVHVFTKGSFKAVLNMQSWVTRISREGSFLYEFVLVHKACTVTEYTDKLNSIISKFKTDESRN